MQVSLTSFQAVRALEGSDANILIEIGGLVAPMFSLDYQFAVPDILYL